MLATEWIFTLFASTIPIEQTDSFFDLFFTHSWPSLYKLIVYVLRKNEKAILEKDNISDMIIPIKGLKPKSGFNGLLASFPFLGSFFGVTSWRKLIEESQLESINERKPCNMNTA